MGRESFDNTYQKEHMPKPLFLNRAAPIPCTRQTSVNTRPRIEEIVSARAIEAKSNSPLIKSNKSAKLKEEDLPVTEEIPQNLAIHILDASKFVIDIFRKSGFFHDCGYLREGVTDGEEDSVDLGIFVYPSVSNLIPLQQRKGKGKPHQ